ERPHGAVMASEPGVEQSALKRAGGTRRSRQALRRFSTQAPPLVNGPTREALYVLRQRAHDEALGFAADRRKRRRLSPPDGIVAEPHAHQHVVGARLCPGGNTKRFMEPDGKGLHADVGYVEHEGWSCWRPHPK